METAPGYNALPVTSVRLFATAREIAGSVVAVCATSVSEVRAILVSEFGEAMADVLDTSRIWVNGEAADDSWPVAEGDEVAVVPPVSGGMA